MKNIFFLFLLLICSCAANQQSGEELKPGPHPHPVPVDPDATKHATGFNKLYTGHGLAQGADFKNSDMFVGNIPITFDWRNLGFSVPVRDQGSCGSCWAFSTIAGLDASMMIFDWHTDLASEQEVVDCDKDFAGCNGGDFAGDYLVKNGVSSDHDYPYKAQDGSCQKHAKLVTPYAWHNVGAADRNPTQKELQAAIMQFGYVSVSVYAHSNWDGYTGGVMEGCKKSQANHLVNLVGWDKSGNWIVRNQWGDSWGDHGYATMPVGCDSIGDEAAYIVLRDGTMSF
jgi:C1A family cysteine protease